MTKKTKILTIVISILAFLVLIVVLSSTVFAVSKISVDFKGEKNKLIDVSNEQIVQESGLKTGTNVFFVGKSEATQKLEQKYAYLQVLAIETCFPSELKIHCRERNEVFAIQQTGFYYLVDSDFKVLDKKQGDFVSSQNNALKLVGVKNFEAEVASFVRVGGILSALKTLEQSFFENTPKESTKTALEQMEELFLSVSFNDFSLRFETFCGVKASIYAPNSKQQQKVKMLEEVFNSLTEEQKTKGTILVGETNGVVTAFYDENA